MLRRLLVPAIAAALLAAPAGAEASGYARGHVIVKYKAETAEGSRASVLAKAGAAAAKPLPGGAKRVRIRRGQDVSRTLERLRSDPRVEYAVKDYKATRRSSPTTPGPPAPRAGGRTCSGTSPAPSA